MYFDRFADFLLAFHVANLLHLATGVSVKRDQAKQCDKFLHVSQSPVGEQVVGLAYRRIQLLQVQQSWVPAQVPYAQPVALGTALELEGLVA